MTDAIIEVIVKVIGSLLMMVISVGGAYLMKVISRNEKLKGIQIATQMVIDAAMQTAAELQQTVVDGLKAASEDGKLSPEEINVLGETVVEMTLDKLSDPTINLLKGAGSDVEAIIHGATEDWINRINGGELPVVGNFPLL